VTALIVMQHGVSGLEVCCRVKVGQNGIFFAYILTTNYAAFLCSPESFSAYATDHGRGFQIWNSSHITTHRVLLVRATSSKIVRGSGILNRIGMKFGNNVLKVNTHRSTEYFDSS